MRQASETRSLYNPEEKFLNPESVEKESLQY